MRPWHLQGGDAMMHMLVAPDGGGGELQPFAAPLAEQELELHRDNADDGLEGHVRYVRASKSFPLPCWSVCKWFVLVAVGALRKVSPARRGC
jgi:hypothetical protein